MNFGCDLILNFNDFMVEVNNCFNNKNHELSEFKDTKTEESIKEILKRELCNIRYAEYLNVNICKDEHIPFDSDLVICVDFIDKVYKQTMFLIRISILYCPNNEFEEKNVSIVAVEWPCSESNKCYNKNEVFYIVDRLNVRSCAETVYRQSKYEISGSLLTAINEEIIKYNGTKLKIVNCEFYNEKVIKENTKQNTPFQIIRKCNSKEKDKLKCKTCLANMIKK